MQDWEKIKAGFVIMLENGEYVWEILANGHPEQPVIYRTKYLWEAKAYKTMKGAMKARDRVRAQAGSGEVWSFIYFETLARRVLRKKCD